MKAVSPVNRSEWGVRPPRPTSTILLVDKDQMVRLLHKERALSDRFIAHMLARNIRIEQDLVDQLFNSSEKRLARTLLLFARYGKHDTPVREIPLISQATLADMVGTTRSRVNPFMKKCQRLGFIDYTNGLKINNSLLTVVLHEQKRGTVPLGTPVQARGVTTPFDMTVLNDSIASTS